MLRCGANSRAGTAANVGQKIAASRFTHAARRGLRTRSYGTRGAEGPGPDRQPTSHRSQNQTIFSQGEPINHAYKIVSGVVRLCKHLPDGRRQIAQFLFPATISASSPLAITASPPKRWLTSRCCRFHRSTSNVYARRIRIFALGCSSCCRNAYTTFRTI